MKKRRSIRKPVKPTIEEMEERIEFVMELEASALLPGAIKRMFREKFGDVSHVTINDYILRARARLQESHKDKAEELAKKAVARYEAILRDPSAEPHARIAAQTRIDKIWGVEAPARTELSGANGGAIQIEQLIAASELTPDDVKRALAQTVNTGDE